MGKEILTFGNIAIEKNISYRHKNPLLEEGKEGGEVDIEKVLVSNKISFDEKNLNTLLVTCIMVIKLNH